MPRVPHDVDAILKKLAEFLDSQDETGRVTCDAKCGVYVFYDYDGRSTWDKRTRSSAPGFAGTSPTREPTPSR